MNLMEELQQAADTGRQQRSEDVVKAAEKRAAARLEFAAYLQQFTEAAVEELKHLPERMQAAAGTDEEFCTANVVPKDEIDFPYRYAQQLHPSTLTGVSRRMHDIMQEAGLNPRVMVEAGLYLIQIPVPQETA